jgi:YggT family protein
MLTRHFAVKRCLRQTRAAGPACLDLPLPITSAEPRDGAHAQSAELDGLMEALRHLIEAVFQICIWTFIASAILSWLVAFDVVNRRNPLVNQIGRFLYQVTNPVLRPIRRVLPLIGGVDMSPLVVILLLWFIHDLLFEYVLI